MTAWHRPCELRPVSTPLPFGGDEVRGTNHVAGDRRERPSGHDTGPLPSPPRGVPGGGRIT
ncbi:MAG: hypothetical protein AVDCRST_MAG49-105 [uncultured Thermomicrobiales bacterium]|uniref:Uncharacterized protein n=1 Tax=uncultured Thermomicrobiales bacterium TaxID=1645740 RepID=A0A6J4TWJ7_9BACT|nr:MAG: hypothetical protein AVDCRST_MAG49-105 [uncultured Thermomicrobiales bacterium]